MRNVSRQFGVTCRLQTPLQSPVSLWAFHTGDRSQFVFAFHVLRRKASIIGSLFTVADDTPFGLSSVYRRFTPL